MIDREELLRILRNDLRSAGLDPNKYLTDVDSDADLVLTGTIEAIEIKERSPGALKNLEIYLRPAGWYKQASRPLIYPVSDRKGSEWHRFIVALDELGIPVEGRPDNLIGEVLSFKKQDLVYIPVRRWRDEDEVMAHLKREHNPGERLPVNLQDVTWKSLDYKIWRAKHEER